MLLRVLPTDIIPIHQKKLLDIRKAQEKVFKSVKK